MSARATSGQIVNSLRSSISAKHPASADGLGRTIGRLSFGLLSACALVFTSPVAFAAPAHKPTRHACCHVAAGTPVAVALVDQVSTVSQKRGDTFALRLAAPLIVNGMVVLPAGAPGAGEVIEASHPGIGGKSAKMVLAANYVRSGRRWVRLNALQLARPGHDNSTASQVLGLSGMAFAPLGIVGIVLPGGEVVFHPGTIATAKVAYAIDLPPLRRASRSELAVAASAATVVTDAATTDAAGPISIPPPPAGQGQVVFFRAKSLLGLGQWFNVREAGKALGKLTNGAYFIQVVSPGPHTYTAILEPELRDHLKLDVDAGETYFVEGTLTGGLVISAADLTPSSREKFDKAAKDLKLAAAPTNDQTAQPAADDSDTAASGAPPSSGAAAAASPSAPQAAPTAAAPSPN